jgi:hypothetical protein
MSHKRVEKRTTLFPVFFKLPSIILTVFTTFIRLSEKGDEYNRVSKVPFTVQSANLCLLAYGNKITKGLRNKSKESNQNFKISVPTVHYFVVCNKKEQKQNVQILSA